MRSTRRFATSERNCGMTLVSNGWRSKTRSRGVPIPRIAFVRQFSPCPRSNIKMDRSIVGKAEYPRAASLANSSTALADPEIDCASSIASTRMLCIIQETFRAALHLRDSTSASWIPYKLVPITDQSYIWLTSARPACERRLRVSGEETIRVIAAAICWPLSASSRWTSSVGVDSFCP